MFKDAPRPGRKQALQAGCPLPHHPQVFGQQERIPVWAVLQPQLST